MMSVTDSCFLQTCALPARRFPPPWTVEEQAACFVVKDRDGQQLALHLFRE
jgi:hypothetical protein